MLPQTMMQRTAPGHRQKCLTVSPGQTQIGGVHPMGRWSSAISVTRKRPPSNPPAHRR